MVIADGYCLATNVVICVRDEPDTLVGQCGHSVFDEELLGILYRNLVGHGPRGLIVIGQGKAVNMRDEDLVREFLLRSDLETQVVRGIPPGNPISVLKEKAAELSGPAPDWILAIGSASVIDAAKVLSVWHGDHPAVLAWHDPGALSQVRTDKCLLPVVAVPTCLGSGAEVSGLAELIFPSPAIRFPLVNQELTPRVAVIDTRLCGTVPWQVQAASLVDAFSHLLDPLMSTCARGNLQMPQADASVYLASRLVALTASTSQRRRSSWLHELAWISHLAVTPGLGRTKDASVAHRIEHLLSPRLGWSHGIGLARVIPAFIEVLEDVRHEAWLRIAAIVARIFDEEDSPERLLRRWFKGLGITHSSTKADTFLSDEVAKETIRWFGMNGEMPGPLRLREKEVVAVVDRVLRPRGESAQMQKVRKHHPVDERRVFGQPVVGKWDLVILTPIPSLYQKLISRLSGNTATGWFLSTTCRKGCKAIVLISPPPSAALATDALELARKADAYFERVLLLGLAGALRVDLPQGTWVVPRAIANATSQYGRIEVDRLTENEYEKLPPNWLGSGPMGTQMVTCASVQALSSETEELLDLWSRLGVEVIDLEAAAVQRWCAACGVKFEGVFVVSDHPLTGSPLWSQSSLDPNVQRSLEILADRITYIVEEL